MLYKSMVTIVFLLSMVSRGCLLVSLRVPTAEVEPQFPAQRSGPVAESGAGDRHGPGWGVETGERPKRGVNYKVVRVFGLIDISIRASDITSSVFTL